MVTWAAEPDGRVTDYQLRHYAGFRSVGFLVVEATVVSPEGRLSARQIGAFSDEHLPGLRRLSEAAHSTGAQVAIQLHHAGGQTNLENTHGLGLIAPSALGRGEITPSAMTEADIARVQADFVAAARRVAAAGFDAIELHGAHGYLLSQFFSPALNKRQDSYGGSLENRARFALEVYEQVQDAVGDTCLVYMRLGVADGIPDGLTLREGLALAQLLTDAGMPLLHVSSGIGGAPPVDETEGDSWSPTMHLAKAVKQAVNVPVIGVGGIIRPEQAEAALKEGVVDSVAVGKAHLADPLWSHKIVNGQQDSINICHRCPRCGHYKHPFTCPARM